MLAIRQIPILLLATIFLVGCHSSSPLVEGGEPGDAGADSSLVYTQAIHVLVDGADQGVIPRTVRIRRSFGIQEVSLWQAGEEIRTYEIEMVHTSDGIQTQQGFWSTSSTDGQTYDVRNLPMKGETTFRVPFSNHPMKIEDQTYGVTLLVSD